MPSAGGVTTWLAGISSGPDDAPGAWSGRREASNAWWSCALCVVLGDRGSPELPGDEEEKDSAEIQEPCEGCDHPLVFAAACLPVFVQPQVGPGSRAPPGATRQPAPERGHERLRHLVVTGSNNPWGHRTDRRKNPSFEH